MSNQQTLTPLPGQFSRGVPNAQPQNQPEQTQLEVESLQHQAWLHDGTTVRMLKKIETLYMAQMQQAARLALKPGATPEEIRVTAMKAAVLEQMLVRIQKNEFTQLL